VGRSRQKRLGAGYRDNGQNAKEEREDVASQGVAATFPPTNGQDEGGREHYSVREPMREECIGGGTKIYNTVLLLERWEYSLSVLYQVPC